MAAARSRLGPPGVIDETLNATPDSLDGADNYRDWIVDMMRP